MTKLDTIKDLERKYHVHITCEYVFSRPFGDNTIGEMFKVYSADNCHWDTVIGYRALRSMLKEDKTSLARLWGLQTRIERGE